jgi:hypothetical protein
LYLNVYLNIEYVWSYSRILNKFFY